MAHRTSKASVHRRQSESLGVGTAHVVAGVSVLVALVSVIVVASLILLGGQGEGRQGSSDARETTSTRITSTLPSATAGASVRARPRWLVVLRGIDRRRETAWRLGRPDLLGRVYTTEAGELGTDRRMLNGYRARGMHVTGVTMRFLSVRAQRATPRSVSLLVVDQLGPAVAIDRAGGRHQLPRDVPTRHRIELAMVNGQWRIAAIVPA